MEKILLRSAGSDQKAFTTGLRSLSLRLFCGEVLLVLPKQPKTGKKGLLSAVFMNFCIAKRLSDRFPKRPVSNTLPESFLPAPKVPPSELLLSIKRTRPSLFP